jgi:hypothetical protein
MRLRFILICQLSGKSGNLRQFHLTVWADLEKFSLQIYTFHLKLLTLKNKQFHSFPLAQPIHRIYPPIQRITLV